jgi:hypothetical protein
VDVSGSTTAVSSDSLMKVVWRSVLLKTTAVSAVKFDPLTLRIKRVEFISLSDELNDEIFNEPSEQDIRTNRYKTVNPE